MKIKKKVTEKFRKKIKNLF